MHTASPTDRRFNLCDGMIVVAAAAVTLAWWRIIAPVLAVGWRPIETSVPLHLRLKGLALNVALACEGTTGIWFPAFAFMRLRRPRPPFRVVALQPGMVAFWAVALTETWAFVFSLCVTGAGWLVMGGACVFMPAAWLALKRSGRWSPEPSWIDRFGRVLGVCWWASTWLFTGLLLTLMAGL